MIMPVELTPAHSPRKNAPYELRPCNSPRTDISNYNYFRGVYSQKCLHCYYETGCWFNTNGLPSYLSQGVYQ
jgi:hypothetical protein